MNRILWGVSLWIGLLGLINAAGVQAHGAGHFTAQPLAHNGIVGNFVTALHTPSAGAILTTTLFYSATLVGEIGLGAAPHGVALLPSGQQVYVTDFTARSVSVIDVGQRQVSQNIAVGRGAVNVVISANGQRAYVTNELEDTLSVIDTLTQTVIQTIALLDRPHGMALSVDPTTGEVDRRLFVANLGSNSVSVVDTRTLAVITHVLVGNTPDSPAVTSDGRSIWVTNYADDRQPSTISQVDGLTLQEVFTLTVGVHPHGIRFAPDQRTLFVSVQGSDQISVVDTQTRQIVRAYPVGDNPHGLGMTPDGQYLWTGDLNSHTSTLVVAATGASLGQLATGPLSSPHGIAFTPDGYRAYISDFSGRRLLVVQITRPTLFLPVVLG